VFISITLLTLGIVAFITIHDWVMRRATAKSIQKLLTRVEQSISLQDWEKAEQELAQLLEKGKAGKEAYLLEIKILRGKGSLHEALQKVAVQSRMFPEELLFRLEEGKVLLELNRTQEALTAFQVCAPILRGESDLVSLASALCKAGHPQECLDALAPYLKHSLNGQMLGLAGDAFYELKLFSEAIIHYRKALDLGYKTHQLYVQLGHAYRRYGNLTNAEKTFRNLLEKDAGDSDATLGLGACLQERGQHNKALLIYQASLVVHTKDLRLLHQAAYAALRSKKYRFAEVYFFEVLRQQEADPSTLAYYGFCLESQKKWQEAEQTYLKLVQLFPNYYQGYRALAWMFGVGLSQTLSHTQGLNFAHVALKLKHDPISWEILSACAARTGQFDKAYQIQLALSKQDKASDARARRQQTLRTLRKKIPLGDTQVSRTQVA
jgi:tetratricopeptide (TPR) repeat protein